MPCYTDYSIPKHVLSSAIIKPPDPDSNWCETNFHLRQLPKEPDHLIENRFWSVFDLPSTIDLKQVSSELTISCQTNFSLRQLLKYPECLIPKDVPSLAIFKPPEPDSIWCETNFHLRQLPKEPDHLIGNRFRPVFDLPSTINLKQVSSEFTISCQTNFRLRQLPKEPDHLIGNRFRPVPNLPSTINLEQRAFLDFAVSCQTNCLRQHQKEPVNLSKSIKFEKFGNQFQHVLKNESLSTYHRISLKKIQQQTVEVHLTNSLRASWQISDVSVNYIRQRRASDLLYLSQYKRHRNH